jgi:hypothetical protein
MHFNSCFLDEQIIILSIQYVMEQILKWENTQSVKVGFLANQLPNLHKETNTSNVPKSNHTIARK